MADLVTYRPRMPRFLRRFEEEMEALLDRAFGAEGEGVPERWLTREWVPRTDLAETDNAFEVTVDLPGFKPEEFSVEMHNGDLWIRGEHKEEKEEKGKTYHSIERRYGSFRRIVTIPGPVLADKINAEYQDGVLTVTLPKTKEAQPKPIKVTAKK